MITEFIYRFTILFFLLACSAATQATGIWDNGLPDRKNGGGLNNDQVTADDFVLSEDAKLQGVGLWTLEEENAWDGTLNWFIFSDNGSPVPATLVASGKGINVKRELKQVGIALGPFSFSEYLTTFDLPIELSAGVYWLAISMGAYGSSSPYIFWESTAGVRGDPSVYTISNPPGAPWIAFTPDPFDTAFYLIPAPAPVALLLLPTLILIRKRRTIESV